MRRPILLTVALASGCFSESPLDLTSNPGSSSSDDGTPASSGASSSSASADPDPGSSSSDASESGEHKGTASSGDTDADTDAASSSSTSSSDDGTSSDGSSDDSSGSDSTTGPIGEDCTHDPCVAGGALAGECDPCVAEICGMDPYCCTTSWDFGCTAKVETVCGGSCA